MSTKYHLTAVFEACAALTSPGWVAHFITVKCKDWRRCAERGETSTPQEHIIGFYGNTSVHPVAELMKSRIFKISAENWKQCQRWAAAGRERGDVFRPKLHNSCKHHPQASTPAGSVCMMNYFSHLFLKVTLCDLEIGPRNAWDSSASYPNAWHLGVRTRFNNVVACCGLHCGTWGRGFALSERMRQRTHTLFTYMLLDLHCSIPVVVCMSKASQPTHEERKLTIIDVLC